MIEKAMSTNSFSEKPPAYQQAKMPAAPSQSHSHASSSEWLPAYEHDINANMRAFGDPEAQQGNTVIFDQGKASHRPWWKRKRTFIIAIFCLTFLVSVIAAIIGGIHRMDSGHNSAKATTSSLQSTTTVLATQTNVQGQLTTSILPRSSAPAEDGLVIITVTVTAVAEPTETSTSSSIVTEKSTTTDVTTLQATTTASSSEESSSSTPKTASPTSSSSTRSTSSRSSSSTSTAPSSISSAPTTTTPEPTSETTTSLPAETTEAAAKSSPAASPVATPAGSGMVGGLINFCGTPGSSCAKKRETGNDREGYGKDGS
ncbi:hypothetical protein KC343_g10068 [Hortaea werneckii]|nr:hypothetical protein KC352_g14654 [Hortaea werneckii]KAI7565613.1 hypothetical protein KC317_g6249 [Hortaea werneckii]KAI7607970.1 hypothetical protein KC346_g9822 [Hortaea werneckii]KAI7615614.1 hypothetical protein KC343_g10068 [Hortaea werneckii]KAI7656179.1 hypothetical protein KC319_g9795 [Hortaea werneckii]